MSSSDNDCVPFTAVMSKLMEDMRRIADVRQDLLQAN